MPNKHFCQGPYCHTKPTSDRFLKSRGVIRGRYAYASIDQERYYGGGDKYFCSQTCKFNWLEKNMDCVRARTVVPFITHRRESQGYHKVTDDTGYRSYTTIERIDNRNEID
tara:strand:- start:13 stop:345 length:333 start_codon:yes stop_codon:yes gene_type:complete